MLIEEINKLRKKLDKSILDGEDFSKTYQISLELDKLIAEYYKKKTENI